MRTRAAARLKAIRRAKSLGSWDKPYRMHIRVRDVLETRAEEAKEACRRAEMTADLSRALDLLRHASQTIHSAGLDEQPQYVQ